MMTDEEIRICKDMGTTVCDEDCAKCSLTFDYVSGCNHGYWQGYTDGRRDNIPLNALKTRVLAVLKAVEFSGVTYDEDENYDGEYEYWEERCCPVCSSTTEGEHYDDCELWALIKELSDEKS